MTTTAKDILTHLKDVPSLPTASVQVLQRLQDPAIDMQELTRTIEYDASLTGNILRLVNSPYFGASRSIGSVHEAIVRLGMRKLTELIVSSTVTPLIRQRIDGYDLPAGGLWIHSAAVAIGARELPIALNIQAPDYLFTAALLHDVGKIVMGNLVGMNAAAIAELVERENIPFEEAEQQVLGTDHAEVGAALLEIWNLPSRIVDVVRWHHRPDGFEGEPLAVDIVHVADALCLMSGIGTGTDGLNYRASEGSVARLAMTIHTSEAVVAKLLNGVETLRDLFAPNAWR